MTKKVCLALTLLALLPSLVFAQVTLTLSPSKDAAIGYNDGFNTGDGNYGTAVHNSAFKIPSTDLSGYNENRGLVQFNLASIPQGATIISAKLSLYAYTTGSTAGHFGTNNQFYLKRISQAWGENTVTWNNQPATVATNQVLVPAPTSPIQDYPDIDVLALVNDMVANGNNGFMITLAIEDTSRGIMFYSSNYSNPLKHPKLEIVYDITSGCNTMGPVADAAIGYNDGFNSGNDNYGTAVHTSAFKIVSTDSSGYNENRGLIKFDLTGIPPLATITSAKLNLHAYTTGVTQGHFGSANECYLQRVTQNWGEGTVTWNNQPTTTTANQVLLPASTAANQDYLNIDVLGLVNDMRATNNYGAMLTLVNPAVANGLMFCSENNTDSTKRPTLELCWTYSCDAAFTYAIDTVNSTVSFTSATGGNHTWQVNGSNYSVANPVHQATGGQTLIVTHTVDVPNNCSDTYSDTIVVPLPYYVAGCNTAGPQADAALGYHDGFNNGDDNYGSVEHVSAFKIVSTDSSGFNGNRGLLKFDLSVIPLQATLSSAKLSLFAYTTGPTNGHFGNANSCTLQRVTQNWGENTATWNNQPASVATNQVTLPASDSANQNYVDIDVLALINDLRANGNNGIMLKLANEAVGNGLMFCSADNSDSTKHPKLELCWNFACDASFTYAVDTTNYTVLFTPASGGNHTWNINGAQFTDAYLTYQGTPGDTLIVNHITELIANCTSSSADTIILPAAYCNNGFSYNLVGITPSAGESINLVANQQYGIHHWVIDGVESAETTPSINIPSNFGATVSVDHYMSFGGFNCGTPENQNITYPQPDYAFFQSHVSANTIPQNATVYLLKLDYANDQILVDKVFQTQPGTGWIMADSLNDGDYILKATNTPSQYMLPTYHLSSISWTDADVFTINGPGEYPDKDIHLIVSINNPGGTGFISGYVNWADTLFARADVSFEGTTVFLKNAAGEYIAYDIADENGYFEIDSLPLGDYTVNADLAGYTSSPGNVSLTEDAPSANDVEVLVGPSTVGVVDKNVIKSVLLFPNPSNTNTTLQVESAVTGAATVRIVNMLGQVVYSEKLNLQVGKNRFDLTTAGLANGLYHITLATGSKYMSTQKFVKY